MVPLLNDKILKEKCGAFALFSDDRCRVNDLNGPTSFAFKFYPTVVFGVTWLSRTLQTTIFVHFTKLQTTKSYATGALVLDAATNLSISNTASDY